MNANNTLDVRRWLITVALAMLVLVAGGGMVLAGHHTDVVASYTGCLSTNSGTVTQVAVGNVPLRPCKPDQTEVHVSGGDITAVTAGDGLTGGASNGAAPLALAPTYQLPQTCTNAQVPKWDGSAWSCAADDAGQQYTAGTGLELNGTEFSLDRDYRLPQGCEAGQAAGFGPTATSLGDWQCSQYALASQTCPSGQFATAITADGSITCRAPNTGPPGGPNVLTATLDDGPGIPDNVTQHEVLRLRVGAGTWAIQAKVQLMNDDRDFHGTCALHEVAPGVTNFLLATSVDSGSVDGDDGDRRNIPLMAVASAASERDIVLTCSTNTDGVSAERARIFAFEV